jgi:ubiquinol-cytochrome c reductase cytochrome c1 subunit
MMMPTLGLASGGNQHLDEPNIDLSNLESLRNGAKTFMTYCLNCHSAAFSRYARVAKDLEMSEAEMQEYMYATEKLGDTMTVSIDKMDAKQWFGTLPPDLSVISRSRKPAWLYTYLRSFYIEEKRPFGVNNTVFKDVAMPHVLIELQGEQMPVYGEGNHARKVVKLELKQPGKLSAEEYDVVIEDLVNFLVYLGEPAKLVRYSLGKWVILFLVVLTILLYLLKKEYWRDIH